MFHPALERGALVRRPRRDRAHDPALLPPGGRRGANANRLRREASEADGRCRAGEPDRGAEAARGAPGAGFPAGRRPAARSAPPPAWAFAHMRSWRSSGGSRGRPGAPARRARPARPARSGERLRPRRAGVHTRGARRATAACGPAPPCDPGGVLSIATSMRSSSSTSSAHALGVAARLADLAHRRAQHLPRSVTRMTWSSGLTIATPTTGPLRSLASIRMTPLPPRLCRRNSPSGVCLP
jgi:hypothetical protein